MGKVRLVIRIGEAVVLGDSHSPGFFSDYCPVRQMKVRFKKAG